MKGKMLLILAATLAVCSASGSTGYGFLPESILECKIPNPAGIQYDGANEIPEPIPFIPLQPGPPGTVYLPVTTPFFNPITGHLNAELNKMLAEILNPDSRVTFIGEIYPTRPPVLPSTVLPGTVPISSGAIPGGAGTTVAPPTDYRAEVRDILQGLPPAAINPANIDAVTAIVGQLTDRCVPTANWTRLPPGYFPQWISAGLCSADDCSIPNGLTCNYDFRFESLIPLDVLRWDCCWSIRNRQWRWECGWRRVTIPLAGRCACSCFDLQSEPNAYTGRINGVFTASITGVNT